MSSIGRAPAALLVVALAASLTPPSRVLAQETPSESAYELRLIDQPVWHEPGDPLGLSVRIFNEGDQDLENFALQLAVYDRNLSRSDLHESFDGLTSLSASSFQKPLEGRSVPAGTTLLVDVEEPLETLVSFDFVTEPGVYPLTVSLLDENSQAIDSFTTFLLFFPELPPTRLNVVPLVTLNEVPGRGPDGVFSPVDDTVPIRDAVGPDGWLLGLLRALQAPTTRALKFGLAPSPRTVDELADMSDGFRSGETDEPEDVPAADPQPKVRRRLWRSCGSWPVAAVWSSSMSPIRPQTSSP